MTRTPRPHTTLVFVAVVVAGGVAAVPTVSPTGTAPVDGGDGATTGTDVPGSQRAPLGSPDASGLGPVDGSVVGVADARTSDGSVDVRAIAVHAAETVTDPTPVVLVAAGSSRFDDGSDALDHETRRRIREAVSERPGIHLAGVASAVEEPVSTVRYHTRVLERDRAIGTEKIRGSKRLFPPAVGDHDRTVQAAIADDASRSVLQSVRRHGPATVSELADHLDRAPSTVSHHLCRLDDDGLVTRDRDGERVVTTLTEAVRDALRDRR
ncbi:helix-turn-helix domain-containing protein [Halobaculum sp. CBA1158]|uniref:winged helix-turn-helix transcriptional regulator n=1 Tax=Halobaculum sp. CBA1158 TaxID=2904243 RepID=UPI001F410619|nr:helix-turn-helix domain-containing protein [Halobaculum sp. CBA1158]UIO98952.1 helix-turn-helix domain-containing protein [Halobaculum sp. CBA1158]